LAARAALSLTSCHPLCGLPSFPFPNTIGGALDLDNLADREIKPVFKANGMKWKGWHAHRRGLATNLHEFGVPDKVIQAILRHEDVSTTQRSYIKTPSRDGRHEAIGSKNNSCSSRAAGLGELIAKSLKIWSRRSDLNR